MDLTRIAVKLRPRSPWEGIDLGFMLARRWFVRLWMLWLAAGVPLMLLLILLPLSFWLKLLLLWWCKPLYEPPLLHWLGRGLFGERPDWREMRQRWRSVVVPQLIPNLTWRRFHPARSFVMPVAVLERLKGKARAQRIRVLGRKAHGAGWLTVIGLSVELTLVLSYFILLLLLIPQELVMSDWFNDMLLSDSFIEWSLLVCLFLAMSLVAPFYLAGGFALYLSRRGELEAWDLELGLRRMAQRHRRQVAGVAGVLLGLGLSLAVLTPAPAYAMEVSREEVSSTIDAVLAEEDFGRYEKQVSWKYIGNKQEEKTQSREIGWLNDLLESFTRNIAAISEFLLWLLAGILLAYLIHWFLRNRGLLDFTRERAKKAALPPTHVAGLDLRPESLPDDPVRQAERMIETGDCRGALSLLYRAALSSLMHRHALRIVEGATEGECLRLATTQLDPALLTCFSQLTRLWVQQAYAHRSLEKSQVLALCGQWQGCFGAGHVG